MNKTTSSIAHVEVITRPVTAGKNGNASLDAERAGSSRKQYLQQVREQLSADSPKYLEGAVMQKSKAGGKKGPVAISHDKSLAVSGKQYADNRSVSDVRKRRKTHLSP